MNRLIRFAFAQLYTTFAWTYDAVAHLVSFGEWRAWGGAALAYLPAAPCRVLEIAHGPGHVHAAMRRRGFDAIGIDLSQQMGALARRRLLAMSGRAPDLARADALRLPFPNAVFDAALSTFPSEFVFLPQTLREVARVLRPGGRFVIVPTAQFHGGGALTRLVEALYRITGQRASLEAVEARVRAAVAVAGFALESQRATTARAEVVVWVLHAASAG